MDGRRRVSYVLQYYMRVSEKWKDYMAKPNEDEALEEFNRLKAHNRAMTWRIIEREILVREHVTTVMSPREEEV